MARIAYLTAPAFRGVPFAPGEVHSMERESLALLRRAGEDFGLSFEVVFWDDPTLPEQNFDLAIIRTCWDYHERPDQFVATLEGHERAGLPVLNHPSVVRWNARKTYLRELGAASIETLWFDKIDADVVARAFDALNADDIVIKPQFGGGSVETIRLQPEAWRETDLAAGPAGAGMIQPYLRAIETEGERSLIFFNGGFSHAVRKIPRVGDWRANVPNETRFIAEAPPADAMQAAEAALARSPKGMLYVRVDLVLGNDGHWRVIEIEAIEPYLFLDFAPEAPRLFAGAIAGVLAG